MTVRKNSTFPRGPELNIGLRIPAYSSRRNRQVHAPRPGKVFFGMRSMLLTYQEQVQTLPVCSEDRETNITDSSYLLINSSHRRTSRNCHRRYSFYPCTAHHHLPFPAYRIHSKQQPRRTPTSIFGGGSGQIASVELLCLNRATLNSVSACLRRPCQIQPQLPNQGITPIQICLSHASPQGIKGGPACSIPKGRARSYGVPAMD